LESRRHSQEPDMEQRLASGNARILATPTPIYDHFGDVCSLIEEPYNRRVSRSDYRD